MTLAMDKQRFAKLLRKAAICAVAALVAALVLEWLQVTTEPRGVMVVRDESSGVTALNLETSLLTVCAHQNGSIIVAGRPAQIQFNLNEALTMDTVLVSTDRIDGPYVIRVLYAVPGEELDVERSTEITASAGQSLVTVDIPRGDYDQLAVQVAGKLAVTAVEYSDTDQINFVPEPSKMNMRRMVKLAAFLFILYLVLDWLGFWRFLKGLPGRIARHIPALDRSTFKGLLVFLGTGVVAYLLARWLVSYYLQRNVSRMTNFFCVFFAIAAGCLFCFRKALGEKPEVFFVIFALLTGSLISFFTPDNVRVSWDDGFHVGNASVYSFLGEERITEQDILSRNHENPIEYDLSKLDQWHADQTALYRRGAVSVSNSPLDIAYHWSMTQGIGMFLGRVFRFPYWMMWSMGRFTGLLAYILVGYFAIRRLHSGKMIMVAVLMIPEAIFLASQYSYDPGVTAFLSLGMSYCFAEWQEMDRKITWKNAIIMVVALFLGCLIKAIYFPLFLIPLFLPKVKFESSAQRKRFMLLFISAMIAMILYFMIPFLTGNGEGDLRGGGDVNAFGQVSFILHNPLQYTQILLRFLRWYFGPEITDSRYCLFAYLGKAPLNVVYWGLMIAVCFTDRSERELTLTDSKWVRLFSLFLLFGTMCLVATALYVSFTPVGLDTINGCQPRYTFPVIFPAMMLLGSGRVVNRTNRTLYNGILFGIIGYVDFIAVLCVCLGQYT